MAPQRRRQFLHAAAASTAGLAGCSRFLGSESTRTATATEASDPPGQDSSTDPKAVVIRAATDLPPVRLGQADETRTEPFEAVAVAHDSNGIVGTQSAAESLTVADGIDAEPVGSFVEATEFSEATLYLESIRIEDCFRLHLCRVAWSADEIRTDYVRRIRPYDERCRTDEVVYESRLIRIPAALDGDAIHGFGSSIGGGGRCDERSARGTGGAAGGASGDAGGEQS